MSDNESLSAAECADYWEKVAARQGLEIARLRSALAEALAERDRFLRQRLEAVAAFGESCADALRHLGRNLAVAGALAEAYARGRADGVDDGRFIAECFAATTVGAVTKEEG